MQWTSAAHATRAVRVLIPRGRRGAVGRGAAAVTCLAVAGVVLASRGAPPPPRTGISAVVPSVATAAPTPVPTPEPSPTPSPTPAPPAPAPVAVYSGGQPAPPPSYPLVAELDAPSVGVHVPVVAVGVVHGAMDSPEGPLGSAFWREGFWLRQGATPGTAGTATIAGHLDDTAGRPAAFWNIRNLQTGSTVTVTRTSDGAVLTYRIVETDSWTLAQANSPSGLQRIFGGGPSDGVARLTLITCTGHWNGHEYDHRFVAFATLVT